MVNPISLYIYTILLQDFASLLISFKLGVSGKENISSVCPAAPGEAFAAHEVSLVFLLFLGELSICPGLILVMMFILFLQPHGVDSGGYNWSISIMKRKSKWSLILISFLLI